MAASWVKDKENAKEGIVITCMSCPSRSHVLRGTLLTWVKGRARTFKKERVRERKIKLRLLILSPQPAGINPLLNLVHSVLGRRHHMAEDELFEVVAKRIG